MTRLFRRRACASAALTVLCLVLAACGGGEKATSEPPPTATTAPTPTRPPAPPAAPTTPAGPVSTATAPPTTSPVPRPTSAPTVAAALPGAFPYVDPKDLGPVSHLYNNYPDYSAPAKRGGTLKVANDLVWPHFDPSAATASGLIGSIAPVYNKLTRCAAGGEIKTRPYNPYGCEVVPDLAESWNVSSSGMVFTFKLRQGVKFHNIAPVNGREVTSDDVLFSYDYYMNKGAGFNKAVFNLVDKVEAPDRYTVRITIKDPFAEFLESTPSERQSYILPKEVLDKDGDYKKTAIGTGPMQHNKIEGKQRILFTANPNYFKPGQPYLAGYDYQIISDNATSIATFRSGQTHYLNVPQTPKEADAIHRSNPEAIVFQVAKDLAQFVLYVRLDKPPLNDVRVRRALSLAMDRPGIVKDIYDGAAVIQAPVPWGMWPERPGVDKTPWYQFNPTRAKQLLADAGFEKGLQFSALYFNGYAEVEAGLPIWLNGLKNVGVDMKLVPLDNTSFNTKLRAGDYDQAALGFLASQPSMHGWVYNEMHTGAGANFGHIGVAELDKLLENQQTELNAERRQGVLRQIWQTEVDQVFRIPFPTAAQINLYSPKLHNMLVNYQWLWPHVIGTSIENLWVDG